jgi:carboxymethylenebutenolidase
MTYEGMIAETITVNGDQGDEIAGYYARPLGPGPFPGVVVIHHMPGWDEWTREVVRKFAQHGYAAISPHLFHRQMSPGMGYDDAAAKGRAEGGMIDDQVMGDVNGCISFLRAQPYANGKVGAIGFCSGGRHTFMATCKLPVDAGVDCWGGFVIIEDPAMLVPQRPVAAIDMTPELHAPLLGIFGNDDHMPTPEQVDRHEALLKQLGKNYEFHRYDGAGHAFFCWDRPTVYRAEQAVDAWTKIWDFYSRYLSTPVAETAGAR